MRDLFFTSKRAVLTTMVQSKTPERIKELIDKSLPEGAEAFGIQNEQLEFCYRTKEIYNKLFSYTADKPVYVTNYRTALNENKSDEELAEELLRLADYGADLCDVMGDYFDKHPLELTTDTDAVKKQMKLIDTLHEKGAKVLMSSHVLKYTSPEDVLAIALEHQKRGADICKIVTGAENMEQQLENLKIINMLKENLKIPFLFLCGGECSLLRRIGGELGCCMYLCVHEYDELATESQPLLKELKQLREAMKF